MLHQTDTSVFCVPFHLMMQLHPVTKCSNVGYMRNEASNGVC